MATTEERVRQLIRENLEVDGQALELSENLDTTLTELGVPSLDVVSFVNVVSQEFNISFTPEDAVNVNTVQKLIEHIDAQAA